MELLTTYKYKCKKLYDDWKNIESKFIYNVKKDKECKWLDNQLKNKYIASDYDDIPMSP